MKDKIMEQIWRAKEFIASNAHGDFRKLTEYIKKEAEGIKLKGAVVSHKQHKIINTN